ncbi:ribosomal protein L36e-domain-containing protein [Paraphoma chrysanthemicola]|nr:ribosomal protein L36e-domain-containing protein [Paraphoma chrysanthemicola]
MPKEVKQKSGLIVGLNKGHKVTPRTPAPRISRRKGFLSKRTEFVREITREVAGLAPYEKRVIELLRNSKDKRARRLAKKRVCFLLLQHAMWHYHEHSLTHNSSAPSAVRRGRLTRCPRSLPSRGVRVTKRFTNGAMKQHGDRVSDSSNGVRSFIWRIRHDFGTSTAYHKMEGTISESGYGTWTIKVHIPSSGHTKS